MNLLAGSRATDLGPFRAITAEALRRLDMRDRNYGWTVEMQVKAARQGLRVVEVPVDYRPRIGRSKVSGTVRGTVGAGTKIIATILRHASHPEGFRLSGPEGLRPELRIPRRVARMGLLGMTALARGCRPRAHGVRARVGARALCPRAGSARTWGSSAWRSPPTSWPSPPRAGSRAAGCCSAWEWPFSGGPCSWPRRPS